MKPLGSITKDFPFLDTNTRNEIESIMQAATNYCDFANSLAERAADPNSTPLIVFLSLYHASRFQNSVVVETVTNAHPDLPIPIPFTYGYDDYVDVVETIHRAIELIQNSAITFYLLMRLYRASTIGSPEENKTQKMIDNLLRTDKKLRLHSADYLQHIGRRMRFDSQPERAVEYFKRALQLARESDDQWHLVLLSISIGHVESQFTRSTDHYSKAMEYFTEATTISKALGYQNGIATVLNNMAVYSASRGELDEAIACQIEAAQITSELGIVAASTSYNLAGWYASLDDGATSLEWAKISLEQMGGPYAHITMASAYLALDKFKEVESSLDTAKVLAQKGGLEMTLGQIYHISGRLEHKRGDLESAMDNFQRAFDIHERATRLPRVRICLKDMAGTELEMFNPTTKNRNDEHAGPWMERYEQAIRGNDIPGHHGMLMLMKAELRMKQGRHDEADQIVESVLELTNNPRTKFLYQRAIETREKWVYAGLLSPRVLERR